MLIVQIIVIISYSVPIIKKMIEIVENFLKKKKLLCYGGTAINNILPKHAQFYNKEYEVPDYDFYSYSALDHAKELFQSSRTVCVINIKNEAIMYAINF